MLSISVIVPTYNRAHFLGDCLDAVLNQTRPVQEIIVVDDGSTDGTRELVTGYGDKVRYLHQPNSGKSAALNKAMAQCSGDCVWICDDDDLAEPHAAEILGRALDGGNAGYAFGCYRRFSEDAETGSRIVFDQGYWPDLDGTSVLIALLEDFFIFQNATLVRKSVYDTVGPFRTDLVRSQDYEMILRIAARSEGVYVGDCVFLQRVHSSERGSSQDRFRAEDQFDKWIDYDAVIFRDLRHSLPLSAFCPPELREEPYARRAALIQRACVYARRKLWDHSIDDLQSAAAFDRWPLSESEKRIARRFVLSKYGCREVGEDPSIARRLRAIAEGSNLGRCLAESIARSLLWRVREAVRGADVRLSLAYTRALYQLVGGHAGAMVWSALQDRKLQRA